MASQVSQMPSSSPLSSNKDEMRPKSDFQPSIWGNLFLTCPDKNIDDETEKHHQQLKEEVRKMIVAPMANSTQKLTFIDSVQRLGVKHGFNVSCEVFNKFKGEQGNVNSFVTIDVRGLLELYEASYLRVHGEDILDEAISFTTNHLSLVVASLDYLLSEQVSHALKQSIRRGLPRVEARHYLSVYQDIESHNKALLEFAKIDFNMLQLLHRKELSEICRWWKDLDVRRKFPYARDRVVEGYFWTLGVYFEPQYSLGRKIFTKVIAMSSIIDDTYDSYATYDKLIPYTAAIERCDIKCIDQLPEYMKLSYKALLDIFEEMEQLVAKHERQYRVEYVKNEFKHRKEDDWSTVDYYMEEYGVTAEETYDVFNNYIESAWKDMNQEFLKPTEIPTEVFDRSLNLTRVMDVLYREGDGYTYVGKVTKGGITSLLIEQVPL
ncbi:hypothetical protein V6Z11_D05G407500 [Gossypium hirsutum]